RNSSAGCMAVPFRSVMPLADDQFVRVTFAFHAFYKIHFFTSQVYSCFYALLAVLALVLIKTIGAFGLVVGMPTLEKGDFFPGRCFVPEDFLRIPARVGWIVTLFW
ncbi:MAG TPA: hypothetical protein O0X01_07240, partial [Methanocorpusculum sp.]|nr:hypothetical protein [Methanocorpusculum sp.]